MKRASEAGLFATDMACKPTISAEVTSETPLQSLNLNWSERELKESERTKHVHRLHPYLGKYIPQLAEVFLRKYFRPGDTVLDPFVGSGTTLVQANELGINSIGYDIAEFNTLLCSAKTECYDLDLLERESRDVLEKTRTAEQTTHRLDLYEALDDAASEYLAAWFHPTALTQLLLYRFFVRHEDYKYKDMLNVILCRAARSARLTTHYDLDFPKKPQTEPYWCYKHSRMCTPTEQAMQFLRRYTLDTAKRVAAYAGVRTSASVCVHHADSRQAALPPITGVLTSPPYVGLIDYHLQHAYAYHLLGLDDASEHEIGRAGNGTSIGARRLYQEDVAAVLSRAKECMPAGGKMIIVVADRFDLYPTIVSMTGLETEAVLYRQVNRRTGRRNSDFYESVFVLRKR